jgi:hypothetical protein
MTDDGSFTISRADFYAKVRSGQLEITKCGTCVGCKLEREMFALIKRMDDELFTPRLQRLADRYDPPGSQVQPDPRGYEAREIRRERDAVLEYRSRMIGEIVKQYGWPGCCCVVIRMPAASAP